MISGNESLTEPVSKYIDYFVKPCVSSLSAYVQDTTDVLKIKELQKVGSEVFLVTMDVEALYTNIEHQQGLQALAHFLRVRPSSEMPPNDFLLSMTEWTLSNMVIFQERIYKQKTDCSMGDCYSPSYAGLFLGK